MPLHMIRADRESIAQDVHFRWSSILSGAFITLGFAVFFLLLGNSIGFGIDNAVSPAVHGAMKFWSWLYNAVFMVASYSIGAAFSARPSDVRSGGSQGLVSWGLATVVGSALLLLASATARSVFDGTGADVANWLASVIVVVGMFASGMCGMIAHRTTKTTTTEYERTVEEKRTGAA